MSNSRGVNFQAILTPEWSQSSQAESVIHPLFALNVSKSEEKRTEATTQHQITDSRLHVALGSDLGMAPFAKDYQDHIRKQFRRENLPAMEVKRNAKRLEQSLDGPQVQEKKALTPCDEGSLNFVYSDCSSLSLSRQERKTIVIS